MKNSLCICLILGLGACARSDHLGRAPTFTPTKNAVEHTAMLDPGLPMTPEPQRLVDQASLWRAGRSGRKSSSSVTQLTAFSAASIENRRKCSRDDRYDGRRRELRPKVGSIRG